MVKYRIEKKPKLPLDGHIDLTYRCNNSCRHCWLWLPISAEEKQEELSFTEIRSIVDQAREMGCQFWGISGGEPMVRPDFADIFDYITKKSLFYNINTNGTLITREIAQLLTRKGRKMVALYGATAKIHDHITRTPGSFDATMRGFQYLKEAGASFTVQIIPMRDNFHQYKDMLQIANELSNDFRVGASWLHLSACRSIRRNREIMNQRLDPSSVVSIDNPIPCINQYENCSSDPIYVEGHQVNIKLDDNIFSDCISKRRDFHIDPYGNMSFCGFIKDDALRFDLRGGSFRQAWEEFIPSIVESVHGGKEYLENCGSCKLRSDCKWCGVYSYLEHGRYSSKIDYLCAIAKETKKYKEEWKSSHIKYFKIAEITIQVSADLPFQSETFSPAIKKFEAQGAGTDNIFIHLSSSVPNRSQLNLGKIVHSKPPLEIYRQRDSWVYLGVSPEVDPNRIYHVSIFNTNHTMGTIYNNVLTPGVKGLNSLTTFPSDQILLARVLADRQACILHAAGLILNENGILFVGHSDAGKSTIMKMFYGKGEILGDDRIIVRRWSKGCRVYGTWSHGELQEVSPNSAPLRAIFYLEQAVFNEIIPINNKQEKLGKFLSHVIKPFVTSDWWDKTLDLAGIVVDEVPVYCLRFDKSGKVIEDVYRLLAKQNTA